MDSLRIQQSSKRGSSHGFHQPSHTLKKKKPTIINHQSVVFGRLLDKKTAMNQRQRNGNAKN